MKPGADRHFPMPDCRRAVAFQWGHCLLARVGVVSRRRQEFLSSLANKIENYSHWLNQTLTRGTCNLFMAQDLAQGIGNLLTE